MLRLSLAFIALAACADDGYKVVVGTLDNEGGNASITTPTTPVRVGVDVIVTIDTGGCYDEPVSTVVAPVDDGFTVTPYDRVPTGNHLACLMPMHHEAHFWFDHAGPEVIHFITASPEVTRTIDVE